MLWLFAGFLYWLLASFECSLLALFLPNWLKFDLLFVAMVGFCLRGPLRDFQMRNRPLYGLCHGFLAGFMQDCFSINPLGHSMLAYGLAGLLIAPWGRRVHSLGDFLEDSLLAFFLLLAYALLLLMGFMTQSYALSWMLVPQILWALPCNMLCYQVFKRMFK